MLIQRECHEGHRWWEEMPVADFWEIVKSNNYSYGCLHCYYEGVKIVSTKINSHLQNNEKD